MARSRWGAGGWGGRGGCRVNEKDAPRERSRAHYALKCVLSFGACAASGPGGDSPGMTTSDKYCSASCHAG